MSLAAVIQALHDADIQPTGLEVAEALWIAQYLTPPSTVPAKFLAQQPLGEEEDDSYPDRQDHSQELSPKDEVALNNPEPHGTGRQVQGHPVGVPGLPGLQSRRDIQRALRPLRQYGASRRHQFLDEDATAAFIAKTGVWTPIMRPAPERWFDVILAIDSSASMSLWRPLIHDLRTALAGTGAFRDVRIWHFSPQQPTKMLPPGPGSVSRSSRELIDGTGRRLFFIVTDGAAREWHDGSAFDALVDWGSTGSVAILQPLAEQMWTRTGLVPMPAFLRSRTLGTCNNQLHVSYRRRQPSGIPIPVLGVEPNALNSWAQLVVSANITIPLAVTPVRSGQSFSAIAIVQDNLETATDRFKASASPDAYQLAIFLSAVPLALPIMRLVQHVAIPGSGPSTLAEVILGGLISRTGDNTYEFLPGVRDELLRELRRSELATIFSAVSDYITEHASIASQTFAAVAERAGGPVVMNADAFGWVPPAVAARLGLRERSADQRKRVASEPIPSRATRNGSSVEDPSPIDEEHRAARGNSSVEVQDADVPLRGFYLEQVRRLAPPDPPGLIGRENELTELTRFCTQRYAPSYAWWQAEPWAGKTALLAWFVLHPPPGVQFISFFVTSQISGQNTREACIETLLEQLSMFLEVPLPVSLSQGTREGILLDLMFRAAATSAERDRRLVLIVDGLDDDHGMVIGLGNHSIAGLLPTNPPHGMRIIVASRPDFMVPKDVPVQHPLRRPEIIKILTRFSPSSTEEWVRLLQQHRDDDIKILADRIPAEKLSIVLRTLVRSGLHQRAEAIAHSIALPDRRDKALDQVARALIAAGQDEQAEAVRRSASLMSRRNIADPTIRIVLLGPPGSGKGTQAQFIATHLSVPKISTGDIFRYNVVNSTELGTKAKEFMDRGDLVPDEITVAMVRDRLEEDDVQAGFLLDGFPRTVPQAETLKRMLAETGKRLTIALELYVDEEEVVRRLSGRRTCRQCERVWHDADDPPTKPGMCDVCSGELFQRDDDKEAVIRHRLEVYKEQTAQLISFYAEEGILAGVDAAGSVEEVTARALDVLEPYWR